MTKERRQKLPPNMRWRGRRIQACPRIDGRQIIKTFDPNIKTIAQIQDWIDAQFRNAGAGDYAPSADSFDADIRAYKKLPKIAAMPTAVQIDDHLRIWMQELGGDRLTNSIGVDDIEATISRWIKTGYAPATIRKRCTTLQSFFNRMRPKRPNPVKLVTNKPTPPKYLDARGIDYGQLETALATMPDYRDVKRGQPKPRSLAKIVCRIMAYTGLPVSLINAVQAHDLVLTGDAPSVRVQARRKAGGVESRELPLTADAVAAFRDFHNADGYGNVPATVNRSFKKACVRVGMDPRRVVLYDVRHSFLTQLYEVTGDEATVARFAMHAEGSPITARYTRAAAGAVNAAAVQAFNETLTAKRRGRMKTTPRNARKTQQSAAAKVGPAARQRLRVVAAKKGVKVSA